MKIIITICRIIVGSLFIVSGLIKVNDAIGFSYKLEEYFSERALGFPNLIEYALPIAIFIVIGEVLLGVAVLLGAWPKLTTTLILAMTVFFTWLTFYTSHCEPTSLAIFQDAKGEYYIESPDCVLTCGCFGDAIKLKPIESFYKDVALLIFIIPIFFYAWFGKIKLNTTKEDIIIGVLSLLVVAGFSYQMLHWMFPVLFTLISFGVGVLIKKLSKEKEWMMALGVLFVCCFLQYWTLVHLPLKDYRAYAIGSDLKQKVMSSEERIDTTDYAAFVREKITPVTGDTIDFESDMYEVENIVNVQKFLMDNSGSNAELAPILTELNQHFAEWKKEVEELQPSKFVNMYTLRKKDSGETKEIDSDTYLDQKMWEDKSWEILKDKTYSKQISEGYEPPISDFFPTNEDGEEMRDSVFSYDRVFLLVSWNLDHFDTCNIKAINEFALKAQADGAKFFGISAASGETLKDFRFRNQTPFDFLTNDATELKIIVRSNPGLVLIEKGIVINMWANADIPDYEKEKASGFKP
jgi:uncharacterized membrane protein YphA (DoxX/SURF4 family)/peroxiredoxin